MFKNFSGHVQNALKRSPRYNPSKVYIVKKKTFLKNAIGVNCSKFIEHVSLVNNCDQLSSALKSQCVSNKCKELLKKHFVFIG